MVLVISDLIYYPLCIIRRNLYVNHAVSSRTGEILSIIRFYASSGLVLSGLDLFTNSDGHKHVFTSSTHRMSMRYHKQGSV